MREVVILGSVRTAGGKFDGTIKDLTAPELGAAVVKEVVKRSGISPDTVVQDLKGISCPMPSWQDGGQILSCADAIGKAIQIYLREKRGESAQQHLALPNNPQKRPLTRNVAGACPECGNLLEKVEGCAVCRTCGYTRC